MMISHQLQAGPAERGEDRPPSDLHALADAKRWRRSECAQGIRARYERVLLAQLVNEEGREGLGCEDKEGSAERWGTPRWREGSERTDLAVERIRVEIDELDDDSREERHACGV